MYRTLVATLLLGLALSACEQILGIEKATVDPALEDPAVVVSPGQDAGDTVSASDGDSRPSAATEASSLPDSQCLSFDNRRVTHMNPDGTLEPLPEVLNQ